MPRPKLLLALLPLALLLGAPAPVAASLEHLPEAHPYRAVLLRHKALPEETRDRIEALHHTDAPLRPEDAAHIIALAAEVRAAARQNGHASVEWPMLHNPSLPDNPFANLIVGMEESFALIRQLRNAAERLPAAEAAPVYAALLRFGRDHRNGPVTMNYLLWATTEQLCARGVCARLAEFSPEELRLLDEAWADLPPAQSAAEAMLRETEDFIRPFMRDKILPFLLARQAAASSSVTDDEPPPDAPPSLARDFRLSGLVDYGDGERRIHLESRHDRTTIALREGGPAQLGVRLVSIDFETRRALLRRGDQDAIVELESRTIIDRAPISDEELLTALGMVSDTEAARLTLDQLSAMFASWPGSPDSFAEHLGNLHAAQLRTFLADAELPPRPPGEERVHEVHLIHDFTHFFEQTTRRFRAAEIATTAAPAALRHRLRELGHDAPTPPFDPAAPEADTPFVIETTPAGHRVLRSSYQFNHATPLTFPLERL